MGRRSEPRKDARVPVRIFGTDSGGSVFSQKAITVNVSRNGAELTGVYPHLALDEIVGLTYGNNRVYFRVKWVGAPGTAKAGHVGLLNISPEKPLWDFPLPSDSTDAFQPAQVEHRRHPRFRCQNSVEIHVHNGASFWGTVADLSLGGCYLEMPIPLEPGTRVEIGIWFEQARPGRKLKLPTVHRGLGVGIRFTEISDQDLDLIRLFLGKLSPFSRKSAIGKTT